MKKKFALALALVLALGAFTGCSSKGGSSSSVSSSSPRRGSAYSVCPVWRSVTANSHVSGSASSV